MSPPLSLAPMSYVPFFPQEERKELGPGGVQGKSEVGKELYKSFWGSCRLAPHQTHTLQVEGMRLNCFIIIRLSEEVHFPTGFQILVNQELGSAEQSLFTLLLSVSAALPNRLGCLFYKSSKWSLLTAKNKLLITFTWINLVTRCGIHLLSVQQLPLRGMREQAKGSL